MTDNDRWRLRIRPKVFNVLPFDHIGPIISVAYRCGGVEELVGAVEELGPSSSFH